MAASFSIVIASHGADHWKHLAQERALPSALAQDCEVLIEHDPNGTRARVRNDLSKKATGDWIITLDADDELAPGYVEAMAQAAGESCLLTPNVSYVLRGVRRKPRFWAEVELEQGNWMVVGTALPRALFLQVGGWREFTGTGVLNEYDDWDLWIRCHHAGAKIVKVPKAVYIAHMMATSGHRSQSSRQKQAWHQEIHAANFPQTRD